MLTKIERSYVGNKRGWAFSVYYCGRAYPNMVSALFKTRGEAKDELNRYIETGEFVLYGSAE